MIRPSFVILGATGDLTGRYLLPALAQLRERSRLPAALEVIGIAQDDWDTARFRTHAAERLQEHAAGISRSARDAVVASLVYRRADVTAPGEIAAALEPWRNPAVYYLALPPAVAAAALQALAAVRPTQGSRVVIEKPFGTDLESARALNLLVHELFPERMVFRMDHFLGKETVLNILGLRFANRIFEPVWSREHVERVEIVWNETLALEGRAGYYDRAGALRDMIQNHLLQVMCLVGMEPPIDLSEREFRDHKADLLRSVRKMSVDEAVRHSMRARYGAGRTGERAVPAYVDEPGVNPSRSTETFARVTLHIDSWRWAGVPFILQSGKALGQERREIAVHFQPVPHLAFGDQSIAAPNVLRIQLSPDRMSLLANVSSRRGQFALEPIALDVDLAVNPLPAYTRLLVDILAGDVTLAIRDDEAEECWRIVEPILAAWKQDRVPLREYPAGSSGPE